MSAALDPSLDFLGVDPLHEDLPPERADEEMPAWVLEGPATDEEPCDCSCCDSEPDLVDVPDLSRSGAPASLVAAFTEHFQRVQRHTAEMWRNAAAMVRTVGDAKAEFVGDDLALVMNVHPRTGQQLVHIAVAADNVPGLLGAVGAAELNDRHVHALLEEAGRWTSDPEAAHQVVELTLERCRDRVESGRGWPSPGQLRKRVRTAALLLDLTAAEKSKQRAAERRGVSLSATGSGSGQVSIEGPDVIVAQIMDAIRARAEALGHVPGDRRSLQQRMFDAAHELLTCDADGGLSAVPTLDDAGDRVSLRVRGIELSVLMPFSVAAGGDLEVAEIPGYGPILPSTARELLAQARRVQRVAVDAETGRVLAVDDRIPGPARTHPTKPATERTAPEPPEAAALAPELEADVLDPELGAEPPAPTAEGEAPAATPPTQVPARPHPHPHLTGIAALLRRLVRDPVKPRDLSSLNYRAPGRLRRLVELRDRTCTFPGCSLPGRWCDLDHRDAWPHGGTSEKNLHCLCRRHHRAKQIYFEVQHERDGTTVWITPDGRRYRRPPPFF